MTTVSVLVKPSTPAHHVPFFGRTLAEYEAIFNLDLAQWQGCRLLDCPSGPASFVAEARRRGVEVVGCDMMYDRPAEELLACGQSDIEAGLERILAAQHDFSWDYYLSPDHLKQHRRTALMHFAADYASDRTGQRYRWAKLPHLPFDDRAFDLVVSSYLFFIHCDKVDPDSQTSLDYGFHRRGLQELLRVVTREVRLYPVQKRNGNLHDYVAPLLQELAQTGVTAELCPIRYRFRRGCDQMLRLVKLAQ